MPLKILEPEFELVDPEGQEILANVKNAYSMETDWRAWNEEAALIRAHTISHLDHYLSQLADTVEKQGGHVFFANTAEEANVYIQEVATKNNVQRVIKSKSLVIEELNLNSALEEIGCTVLEAHDELRKKCLTADMAVTGCSFGVAQSGSICNVTQDGEEPMVAAFPKTLVAVMEMENIVPTLLDLELMLTLLGRSTSYISILTGPRQSGEVDGPEEFHLVILDNQRSQILGTEFEDALCGIQTDATLPEPGTEVCPVKVPFQELWVKYQEKIAQEEKQAPLFEKIARKLFGFKENLLNWFKRHGKK